VLLASVLLLLATSAGCGGTAQRNAAIVLDRSIGGVALGETRVDVERLLGPGRVVQTHDQKPPEPLVHGEDVRYPEAGLEVWYVSHNATAASRADGVVIAALTGSSRYETPQGVGVGSRLAEVQAIPGIACHGTRHPSGCQHGASRRNKPATSFQLSGDRVSRILIAFAD
jgi:hypothetical protein